MRYRKCWVVYVNTGIPAMVYAGYLLPCTHKPWYQIPELYCANACESLSHRAFVHSFSTDKVDPCAPTLLALPMMIVHVVANPNIADPG